MMATIKGGQVKSIASLKASMKKGGGGSTYLTRVPADASLTVRFLTEPDDESNGWVQYFEHYDQVRKFYPCTDDCPGCTEGDRPSARYLANALDVAESRVIPLVMPKSMAASILKKYEKYATLLDRDYELSRSGTGLDTEYDVTPEPPTKMNLTRFDLIDLWDILKDQLAQADSSAASSDDDDDDDDAPVAKKAVRKPAKAAAPESDDDDDADDDDEDVYADGGSGAAAVLEADVDDDADEDDYMTREDYMEMSLAELKTLAKEDVGFTAAELRGKDKDAIIDMLLEATEEEMGGIADDDDTDDDDSDDSGEEELTEDELRSMSLAEVKNLARELGVRFKAGTSKDDIVDLILDAAAGDDADDDDDDEAPF